MNDVARKAIETVVRYAQTALLEPTREKQITALHEVIDEANVALEIILAEDSDVQGTEQKV